MESGGQESILTEQDWDARVGDASNLSYLSWTMCVNCQLWEINRLSCNFAHGYGRSNAEARSLLLVKQAYRIFRRNHNLSSYHTKMRLMIQTGQNQSVSWKSWHGVVILKLPKYYFEGDASIRKRHVRYGNALASFLTHDLENKKNLFQEEGSEERCGF